MTLIIVLGVVFPLLYRTLLGATPFYLFRTRFYEIPCLRVMFHVFNYFCFFCVVGGFLLILALAYKMCNTGWDTIEGIKVAVVLVITLALIAFKSFFTNSFINLPNPITPCHNAVRNITRSNVVSRKHLNRLGAESFPEMLIYGKRIGLWLRKLLFTMLVIPFILIAIMIVIHIFEADKKWEWAEIIYTVIQMIFAISVKSMMDLVSGLPAIPPVIAIPVFVCCSFLFLFLLNTDRSYLILRFPVMLTLFLALATGLFYCFCMVYPDVASRLVCLGILDILLILRLRDDLKRAAHFLKERRVMKPIAENFAQIFPQAAEIKQRQDCELPALDMDDVALRIENGLHNVEKYSFMALRNMIRFLGIFHVEQERFAAVRIRFMTVRRYTTERLLGGTYSYCHWPIVPVWDEVLFPLDVPNGYVNWDDYNWLGSEWNGVRTCSTCGGTGRVARTETYTERDYEGRTQTRTRTVYETCHTCGGSGRLEYQQAIVTQWQKQIVISVEPTTTMPEYMAEVEDKTYYTMRLIEDRETLEEQSQSDKQIGADLVNSLEQSTEKLKRTQLKNYVHTIEQFHDGRVYRSDVQAIGFWTLRIIFRRLFGKFGWFFGRTSEFYFRTIPLSLQSLLAVSVMLPLCIVIAAIVFGLLATLCIALLF